MLFAYTNAQNLVPNPSFEILDTCPNNVGQITYALPWMQPTTGTPDYYDSCFSFSNPWSANVGVPNNEFGYQNAINNGGAYAGLSAWYTYSQTYREYIQSKLTSTLVANQKYYVSIYVSLSDSARYAVDNLGIYFSQTAISRNDFNAFSNYTPQVQNPHGNFLNDKVNWVKISGTFTATGNEQYITIGNFKNDSATDTIRVVPELSTFSSDFNSAYYYIDNICVSTDSLTCNATVGIKPITNNQALFYYDTYNKKIIVKENGEYNIQVMNSYGNSINNTKLQGYQNIDVSTYDSGCYIIIFTTQQGNSCKKIIINP